jgi:hypothetical protein
MSQRVFVRNLGGTPVVVNAAEATDVAAGITTVTTVGALPTAGTVGRRYFVTDATLTMTLGIGTVVAGTGANKVPVFDDGTNWRIG